MAASLRLRFAELWQRVAPSAQGDSVFDEVASAYGERGRHYHILDHVADCLDRLDETGPHSPARDPVEVAVWLHDVVYDPHRPDNEEVSAAWAARALAGAGANSALVSRVQALIRATDHASEPVDPDAILICDIDLSILGSPGEKFDEYQRRIREEYAWVPEQEYRAARSRILESFLGRRRIYLSDHFRDRYEASARVNLARALAELAA